MRIDLMRAEIIKAYPGDRWKMNASTMPDTQVVAVYNNLRKRDKLSKGKKPITVNQEPQQLSLDELFPNGYIIGVDLARDEVSASKDNLK